MNKKQYETIISLVNKFEDICGLDNLKNINLQQNLELHFNYIGILENLYISTEMNQDNDFLNIYKESINCYISKLEFIINFLSDEDSFAKNELEDAIKFYTDKKENIKICQI